MLRRRDLLKTIGLAAVANSLPGVAFAKADTKSRFVLVVLRGAADGLAIAAPYGDEHYTSTRGELALPPPGAEKGLLKLDGLFGLHPSLAAIHDSYRAGDALIVHAVASPYRERSHFDGQDLLENGANRVAALRDGWLNRALAPIGGHTTQRNRARAKRTAGPARRQRRHQLGAVAPAGCRCQYAAAPRGSVCR